MNLCREAHALGLTTFDPAASDPPAGRDRARRNVVLGSPGCTRLRWRADFDCTRLRWRADFDWTGLRILASAQLRHGAIPWRMGRSTTPLGWSWANPPHSPAAGRVLGAV
ncbi:DUF2399 domain-containing protein [Nonomuraea sp. NPDC049480]|uniref:DUF2399 domain-containing protein n=1 Tax=Nonomuraea sp. NPDC049480 TaxID=3364353 RepID=UPI00379EC765